MTNYCATRDAERDALEVLKAAGRTCIEPGLCLSVMATIASTSESQSSAWLVQYLIAASNRYWVGLVAKRSHYNQATGCQAPDNTKSRCRTYTIGGLCRVILDSWHLFSHLDKPYSTKNPRMLPTENLKSKMAMATARVSTETDQECVHFGERCKESPAISDWAALLTEEAIKTCGDTVCDRRQNCSGSPIVTDKYDALLFPWPFSCAVFTSPATAESPRAPARDAIPQSPWTDDARSCEDS